MNLLYRFGAWAVDVFKDLPKNILAFLKMLLKAAKWIYIRFSALPSLIKSLSLLTVCLAFVLLGAAFSVKTVTITDEDTIQVVHTFSSDAATILSRYGYSLSQHDEIREVQSEKSGSIIIKRAFPISIFADGEEKTIYSVGETVSSALKRAGVSLGEEDLINLSLSENITDKANITIRRVSYATEVLEEEIPFSISQRATPLIKRAGRVVVLTKGKNGTRETTLSRKLIDGQEVSRTVISEKITSSPTTQVSLVGNPSVAASPKAPPAGITINNGVPSSYKAVYEGRGTAYSSSGHRFLTLGCVAVDFKKIPRGSIVYVVSSDGSFVYGVAVAADTGTSLASGHTLVDCFFPTYKESLWFGAKKMKVYVLK
jgi:uncharacterized protein YabE (DUF348 family)